MITAGQLLKKARLERNISLEEAEKLLKIRKKYLLALENNDWANLPSLPYIKGFIKNYSELLGLRSEETLAIFRRQYQYKGSAKIIPKEVDEALKNPLIKITPQTAAFILSLSFLLLFFGYLFYQQRKTTSPPDLFIDEPKEGQTYDNSNIKVKGKTDRDAVLLIDNERIALSANGDFETFVNLAPGVNTIKIESVSKYNITKSLTRTVQYVRSD